VVFGTNAVHELLRRGERVERLYLAHGPREGELSRLAAARGVAVEHVERGVLDRLARSPSHQGAVAVAPPFRYQPLEHLLGPERTSVLVLDGVQDPRNLGAILRTAEAAGATGVLLPRRRSVHVTAAVTKAAAGAVEHLPIALVPGIPATLERARRAGVWAVGLDERGPDDLFSLDLATEPVVLVLGAEGRGLSRLSRERCDVLVRIPMLGRLSSLNVATAAGLAAYEVARRRRGSTTEGV